ncbi:PepSY-associated TM helix domain-containing protein [Flavobacterium sp. FZUC8N2.13]|uniref:PepSY-associated TM helix domain-containing protein n=1 Tax=Flavobacterium zubiriense TaxID=3138075 RepID=A0ABV4TDK3_9FLAO
MNNRNYNIFFHTHTVSGIVISVVLYVIFFAGSFSFFKDDITSWEKGESTLQTNKIQLNFDQALKVLDTAYDLHGRKISFYQPQNEHSVGTSLEASKDSLASKKGKESQYLILKNSTYKTTSYEESYSLGEFIYRLHFLAQIPYPVGYYLSGFIALFFLFAIATGVLLHWKKIISSFYVFRPKEKLKTWWTDAHTSLGMLGLPFQFVYAVTGAFFMIKLLIIAPSVQLLYQGDQEKFYKELEYSGTEYTFENKTLTKSFSINEMVAATKKNWKNFNISRVEIQNYGDVNMHVLIEGEIDYGKKFTGIGKMVYKVATGEVVSKKDPITQTTYLDSVKNILYRIHFGDYGGYGLKIISFVLGILSCFVIISGVMIWLVARDKKNMPGKKRRFNEGVVRFYLAICLSMFPVTALTFIVAKMYYPLGQDNTYAIYFISWLLMSIFFILKKNNRFTNQFCLLSGSILGFLIPITNGIKTGNWFWVSCSNNQFQPFFVDVFWIILSAITLYASFKLKTTAKHKEPV